MTFSIWDPPLPPLPVQECTDDERRIARKCWDLAGVQAALKAAALAVNVTPTAAATMHAELMWRRDDLLGYINCLTKARYIGSEWGLPAGHAGRFEPLKADAYCMGYHRINGVENQRANPWTYLKFAVRQNVGLLIVLSAHPERDK